MGLKRDALRRRSREEDGGERNERSFVNILSVRKRNRVPPSQRWTSPDAERDHRLVLVLKKKKDLYSSVPWSQPIMATSKCLSRIDAARRLSIGSLYNPAALPFFAGLLQDSSMLDQKWNYAIRLAASRTFPAVVF